MFRRTLLTLFSLTAALATTGCDDMAGDPSDPAESIVVSVHGDLSTHVGLLWMSVLFQEPGAPQRTLAGLPVGTTLPVIDGTIDLGGVEPPFGVYARACEGFGVPRDCEGCEDACGPELTPLEDADAYSLARLATTAEDGLDCTFDAFAACRFDDHVHAPGHLVLFVRARFETSADPLFARAVEPTVVEPGVYLVQFVSKRDMTIVPFDGDSVRFVAGGEPVNFF